MKISILRRAMILMLAAVLVFPAVSHAAAKKGKTKTITANQLLQKIFDNYHKQKIKSMVYDETRTVSTKRNSGGADKGLMQLDKENSSTYVMRIFYRAPDKHGYRMLSDPIDGFWPGNPKQENAVHMDERWLENMKETYKLVMSPDTKVNGRPCYILNMVPKAGVKNTFPMTWYIDKKNFTIIKFIHLVRNENKGASTTGYIEYGKVKGRTVPVRAHWTTTVSELMTLFDYEIKYDNYMFNIPLDDSVFRVQPLPPPAPH